MKVSVIIPIYNVAEYIERCLLSALNQTWQDLEIILVNDCTPDHSMEIVAEVISLHSRRNIVTCLTHEKNRGLSAARNTGIVAATGEYLYFLDSDDFLPPESIEELAGAAIQKHSDFVIGNYRIIGNNRWTPPLSLTTGNYEGNLVLSNYMHNKWYVMAWNKLVKRSFLVYNKLFFQEGIIHEDDIWSFKLACTAQNMSVVNTVTYFYNMQPNSIMRAPSIRNLECRILVLGYIYDYICNFRDLRTNRQVYCFFEALKAKYFDRILYFTSEKSFQYQSYRLLRKKKYISPIKALFYFYPSFKLVLQNIHYMLPTNVGYLYFWFFVKLSYYLQVLPLKLKTWCVNKQK